MQVLISWAQLTAARPGMKLTAPTDLDSLVDEAHNERDVVLLT